MSPESVTQDRGPTFDERRAHPLLWNLFALLGVGIAAVLLCYFVILPLDWRPQLFLSVATVLVAYALCKLSKSFVTSLFLTILSLFSTSRYLYYRVTNTFGIGAESGPQPHTLDMIFMVILLFAETYAFLIFVLGCFQVVRPLERKPVALPEDSKNWPTLDIFVPSYSEPLSIVRHTVWAAMNLDWPSQLYHVYILDDGKREDFRRFAEEAGCGYITRNNNAHAKAGNINAALARTHGEYVAIFDCDHVPTRSFLQMVMGWFLKDPKLAMLQTPHYFYSPDPFERNLNQFRKIPNEGELFYGLVQDGNDFWNATFFCGSCAVLRRTALEEIGGIAVETVTEDAHTSLRMQIRGWNTAYINIPQAAGLATESLSSHVGQRIRWARGMAQILRVDNPLLAKGLSLGQRLCYFNAMFHFLYSLPRLIFLTAPLTYLLLGHLSVRGYWLTIFAYGLPHIVLSTVSSSRAQGKYRYSFWNEVYEAVLSPYILAPTLMALINPRLGSFNVTAKGGLVPQSYFDWKIARPYLVLLLLNAAALIVAIPRFLWWDASRPGTIVMNVVWTLFNTVILGAACAVAYETEQRRVQVRVPLTVPAQVRLRDGRTIQSETIELSSGGVSLLVMRSMSIEPTEPVWVRFAVRGITDDIPARFVAHENGKLRLKFETLALRQEEVLTRVLYSRADSWINALDARPQDRPLRSLCTIVGVACRGILRASTSPFRRKHKHSLEEAAQGTQAKTASAAEVGALLVLVALALGPAASARAEEAHERVARARRTTTTSSVAPVPGAFHLVKDFLSLGVTQPIAFHGTQSRTSIHFTLPNSRVVTAATLHIRYRLAAQLDNQGTRLAISVNGVSAGSIELSRTMDDQTDMQATLPLPAEAMLTENSVEILLSGRCPGDCQNENLVTLIEPTSELEMDGQRLLLPDRPGSLPAPFLDSSQTPSSVLFVLPKSATPTTLEAGGIVASWFGRFADERRVRFLVSLGEFPEDNAVVIGAVSALPATLALAGIEGPSLLLRPNPSDPFSKLLVVTGRDDDEVREAALALALGQAQPADHSLEVHSGHRATSEWKDAPRWLGSAPVINLGDAFTAAQLTSKGGTERLEFRLTPDFYYGNRGSIPLELNYRVGGNLQGETLRIGVSLNDSPVAVLSANVDPNLIQHALVALPVSALRPYLNSLKFEWESQETLPGGSVHELQLMRNSTIDFSGIPHFAIMPQLERFADSGYPFTRHADLAETSIVLTSNNSPGELAAYLDLMGYFGAQTGWPTLQVKVLPPEKVRSIGDRDFIFFGGYGDGDSLRLLGSASPIYMQNSEIRLAAQDSWWNQLRRASWNEKGRTRQSIEDLLEADPPAQGVIASLESPFGPGRTGVLILGKDGKAMEAMGTQLAGIHPKGAIYGSVSVFYNGVFKSLYLDRNEYEIGKLTPFLALTLWFTTRIYLVPILVLIICFIPTLWLHPWIERRARLRLAARV